MLKADTGIGNLLYIIIALIFLVYSGVEKHLKKKKQAQALPPQSHEEEDEQLPDRQPSTAQPQSLEEMIRRVFTEENQAERREEVSVESEEETYPVEAQSLETLVEETARTEYRFVHDTMNSQMHENALYSIAPAEEIKKETTGFDFDLRQAILANEILNRKY